MSCNLCHERFCNLYISNSINKEIDKLEQNILIKPFIKNKNITKPEGIVFDKYCNLYVANATSTCTSTCTCNKKNSYVIKISKNSSITSLITLDKNSNVRSVEIDSNDNLYVADFYDKCSKLGNGKIYKFTCDGPSEFPTNISSSSNNAWGLAFDNNIRTLYKSTGVNNTLTSISLNGLEQILNLVTSDNKKFCKLYKNSVFKGLALDCKSRLLVADSHYNKIWRVTFRYEDNLNPLISTFAEKGLLLKDITYITTDMFDNVFVSNYDSIVKIDSKSSQILLTKIDCPRGLAVNYFK